MHLWSNAVLGPLTAVSASSEMVVVRHCSSLDAEAAICTMTRNVSENGRPADHSSTLAVYSSAHSFVRFSARSPASSLSFCSIRFPTRSESGPNDLLASRPLPLVIATRVAWRSASLQACASLKAVAATERRWATSEGTSSPAARIAGNSTSSSHACKCNTAASTYLV